MEKKWRYFAEGHIQMASRYMKKYSMSLLSGTNKSKWWDISHQWKWNIWQGIISIGGDAVKIKPHLLRAEMSSGSACMEGSMDISQKVKQIPI